MNNRFFRNFRQTVARGAVKIVAVSSVLAPVIARADATGTAADYGAAMTSSMTATIGLGAAALIAGVGLFSLFYGAWSIKKGLKVGGKG